MVVQLISSVMFLFISSYFGYHAMYGQRGYCAWQEKKIQSVTLKKSCQKALSANETLHNKVSIIQNEVDSDLLEQYAWLLFRYVDPKKKVLLYQ
jgi:cell division protein FtsB